MSRYFSRLASRTGLLNTVQPVTSRTVAGLQESHRNIQQNLDVQSEYSTAGGSAARRPNTEGTADSQNSTATRQAETGQPAAPQQPETRMMRPLAEKPYGPASGRFGQHDVEHPPRHSEAWHEADVPAQAPDAGGASIVPPSVAARPPGHLEKAIEQPVAAMDKTAVFVSAPVPVEREIKKTEAQAGAGKQGVHLTASAEKRVAPDSVDSTEANMPAGLPEADSYPDAALLNHNRRKPLTTEPAVKAVQPAPGAGVSRTEPNESPQIAAVNAQPTGYTQSSQQTQINIQSITLEVHQREPVQQPVPTPAPGKTAPGPAQTPPSYTRLSRYYLKGW